MYLHCCLTTFKQKQPLFLNSYVQRQAFQPVSLKGRFGGTLFHPQSREKKWKGIQHLSLLCRFITVSHQVWSVGVPSSQLKVGG